MTRKRQEGITIVGLENNPFNLVDYKMNECYELTPVECLDVDDEELEEMMKNDPNMTEEGLKYHMNIPTWRFVDPITNTKLVMQMYLDDDELKDTIKLNRLNPVSMFNSMTERPFNYLVDKLKENKNISVFVTQVFGTTTDYIINYNNYEFDQEIPKFHHCGYKYCENGEMGLVPARFITHPDEY